MFTKQNTKQKVYKTKLKFTNTLCLQNKNLGQVMFAKQTNVYKTKLYKQVMLTKLKFTNTLRLQNKIQNKVYKHVMFTKQNKCLQHKCFQNKSFHTRYVYKTKHKTESLQNKTKDYKYVMFTKQNTKVYKHVISTNQNNCLQSKCLQNKTLQTRYVTKLNKNRKFTKQN